MEHRQPTAVAGLDARVRSFIADARLTASDGITWIEFGTLLIGLLRLVIEGLDHVQTLTGPEKKELALAAVAALFDAVAANCLPLAAWPMWVVIRPALRSLVLALASGAIESMLPLVRMSK